MDVSTYFLFAIIGSAFFLLILLYKANFRNKSWELLSPKVYRSYKEAKQGADKAPGQNAIKKIDEGQYILKKKKSRKEGIVAPGIYENSYSASLSADRRGGRDRVVEISSGEYAGNYRIQRIKK